MLSCIWIGLIYTIALQSHRTTGYPVTLFPVFQGYMALTGYTILQETGFIISIFLGMFIYTVRIGETSRNCFLRSMKFTLISLLSLRITTLILHQFRDRVFENEYLTAVALSVAVLMATFLNQLFQFLSEISRLTNLKQTFRKYIRSVIYPGFFILFLLPAALQTDKLSSNIWEWNLIAGVVTILIIQTGLSMLLDSARFSYSRTRFLENELGKHSEILTNLETPIEALRILADFWYQASEPEAVRVTWNNISMT
jgi:hypothetical protein